jgi:AraC family transcriptional regulator, regulatory protein of adaptative response / methylated-DNA-[protein]-cysteine methyltransferase
MTMQSVEIVASQEDDRKWKAVVARDSAQDGSFVYAVASTGVYCRPSCPSRRPLRARVGFFPTPDAAEAAGYRACRRCEPRSSQTAAMRQVQRARDYLDQHLGEAITLERLGSIARMSPYHLQRTFKRVVGVTPKAYANARRMERMKSRLREGDTVTRATYEAGFGSGSRAYEHARTGLGMTPGTYRNGGRGMEVLFTVVDTVVGQLLVGATERGVCAVMLGDDAPTLEAALRREYPAASIQRGDRDLKDYTEKVVDRIVGRGEETVLPLDVRGSSFQWQVWEALRRIPLGETRSYRAIAQQLGRPTAARAVAQACASNPVALVIPCHRAVRASGELGGYRWGMSRKRQLIQQEKTLAIRNPADHTP